MKILHYSLGYPPNRSGGLVKYALDLMQEQAVQGHQVISLYPGKLDLVKRKSYIKKDTIKSGDNTIVYELYNSLPLALFGGIRTPKDFMVHASLKMYHEFLMLIQPDVIHIHTLMGIHKEFFESAKQLNIKIVYTSHDYFGLAPEPNFFLDGKSYDDKNTIENWLQASKQSMSTNKLRLFQFKHYAYLRKIVNILDMKKSLVLTGNNIQKEIMLTKDEFEEYRQLKEFYYSIFCMIDQFHFNSTISKEVFIKNLPWIREEAYNVISITNTSISKHKVEKIKRKKKVIAYIGPYQEYKGYYEFLKLPQILGTTDFEYRIYGDIKSEENENIINGSRYSADQIAAVYQHIDILFVPSKWKETFGFVVLEALSYGKDVIVHTNVGAKDLVDPEYVYSDITIDVKRIIDKIENPHTDRKIKSMDKHAKEIIDFYKIGEKLS
ncbi:glycosyltransferase [Candidatus Enterococcus ikei]|uniref:Glycosyltransferase n=1 Tax=Candidatus Enterococcus ikei TaxID=2815326 RepID=A0ABS3GZU8_9ENTE|nr:glycosyltransferase [Enterococcus sp. DIV0869a]MBO0440375.1 glycosyltransferase [Enterococcus sp. DIV0869a]